MSIVIQQSQIKQSMEVQNKIQKQKLVKRQRKKVDQDRDQSQEEQQKQNIDDNQQYSEQDDSDSQPGWSSEVIQPAIKSMSFRPKRGTNMKDLIKGKLRKDLFWDKYQTYFGGDINQPQLSQDQEDYEASSSGRDQFDSDFDLTDSYVGKRGRKKGTKVNRRKKKAAQKEADMKEKEIKPRGKRGRKKKNIQPLQTIQKQGQQLKQRKKELIQDYLKKQIIIEIEIDLVKKQPLDFYLGDSPFNEKNEDYSIREKNNEEDCNGRQRFKIRQIVDKFNEKASESKEVTL